MSDLLAFVLGLSLTFICMTFLQFGAADEAISKVSKACDERGEFNGSGVVYECKRKETK